MPTLFLLIACSGESPASPPVVDELETHRRWLTACSENTATYDACQAHCSTLTAPAERTDCYFQLAESSVRWTHGDPRMALNIAYQICNSSPDFAAQCFRHALHEIAITCSPQGTPWMDVTGFEGGDRWSPWQACVSKRVLTRLNQPCLAPSRESYHNMWIADDAPLCGQ